MENKLHNSSYYNFINVQCLHKIHQEKKRKDAAESSTNPLES